VLYAREGARLVAVDVRESAARETADIVTAEGGPASPGLTATRDLIGAVASACQTADIRFMMYYHTGDEDSAWWPYQDWPATFATNGTGDNATNGRAALFLKGKVLGSSLLNLAAGCLREPRELTDARRVLSAALEHCLEGRPIVTRAVARACIGSALVPKS